MTLRVNEILSQMNGAKGVVYSFFLLSIHLSISPLYFWNVLFFPSIFDNKWANLIPTRPNPYVIHAFYVRLESNMLVEKFKVFWFQLCTHYRFLLLSLFCDLIYRFLVMIYVRNFISLLPRPDVFFFFF